MSAAAETQLATVSQKDDDLLIEAMQNSLYPGAKRESIALVLSYCRVNKVDPMTKPVHIVRMKVKTGYDPVKRQNIEEWRDVLMPGIGDYRIKAARSGEYGGKTEPEFGPVIRETLGGAPVSYPQWCKITVHRIVQGQPRAFTAKEYWLENYANDGHSDKPNYMWKKRAFGQLAKCTEAQALRMAFPEFSSSQPTAEEMEGKEFSGQTIDYEEPEARRERPVRAVGPGDDNRSMVPPKAEVTYPPPKSGSLTQFGQELMEEKRDAADAERKAKWHAKLRESLDGAETADEAEAILRRTSVKDARENWPLADRKLIEDLIKQTYERLGGIFSHPNGEADWGESPDSPPWEQEPNESDESGR